MPKSSDKTKGTRKRRINSHYSSVNNTESDINEGIPNTKKKKVPKKLAIRDEISKSKLLSQKVRKAKSSRGSSSRKTEARFCGNGKPMPSLAELEKMFEDSDGDDNLNTVVYNPDVNPERCKAPDNMIKPEEMILSPDTLKNIASKMLEIITEKTIPLDDSLQLPIVHQTQSQKFSSGTPYIVGCKERPQVPWTPKTNVFKGDYIDSQKNRGYNSEEDNLPEKRKNRGQIKNVSMSIFNAKSDEIVARLKESDNATSLCDSSPDSDKTEPYDYSDNSPSRSVPRSFSPLPSTSKDRETFLKNDRLFNESLASESLSNDSSQNDIEIIEIPCETIIIDDSVSCDNRKIGSPNDLDDDCCIIVEPDIKTRTRPLNSASPTNNDFYSTFDLTESYDNDVCEIIDVDDVITVNKTCISKYCKNRDLDSVILVEPLSKQSNSNVLEHTPVNQSRLLSSCNKSCAIPNVPEVNLLTEHSTDTPEHTSLRIAEVVTNFFAQPDNSLETIDLTSVESTMRNKISSWISTLESYIRGQPTTQPNEINANIPANTSQDCNNISLITSTPIQNMETYEKRNYIQDSYKNSEHQSTRSKSSMQDNNHRGLGDCPICMDNLVNSAVASTLCGHVFCMPCIKAAFKANGKKCPTCRKSLKGVGYHQLFL